MKRTFTVAAAAIALGLFGLSAHAGCVDPREMAKDAATRTPPVIVMPKTEAMNDRDNGGHGGIVGMWEVTYSSGGAPGGVAFIQWHDDGTEWENVDFPILGGNICLGVWRQLDHRHVSRSHTGWLYTDGDLTGYFTETETDTVSHDGNSYTGNNDTKFFDLDGNMQFEITGTADAVRFQP